jgi:hypothetical protein
MTTRPGAGSNLSVETGKKLMELVTPKYAFPISRYVAPSSKYDRNDP